ncbi:KTSC domain-containing protein [Candidatus Pacearchaeota archaeon]|nr:KTSC domain-containing protein [Candidatus Pacearchaeota archaeon]
MDKDNVVILKTPLHTGISPPTQENADIFAINIKILDDAVEKAAVAPDWVTIDCYVIQKAKFTLNKYDRCGEVVVKFVSGGCYRYVDVPAHKFETLTSCIFPHKYFANHIAGQYETHKETETDT